MKKLQMWWTTKAWPAIKSWTVAHLAEWWVEIGDHPKAHFISMVFGIGLYVLVKFMVRLV